MDVVRVWRDVPQSFKGAVLAIGNFDGVHRGHQAVLGEARRIAEGRGLRSGAVLVRAASARVLRARQAASSA